MARESMEPPSGGYVAGPRSADGFHPAGPLLARRREDVGVEKRRDHPADHRSEREDQDEVAEAAEGITDERRPECTCRIEARARERPEDHHEEAKRGADRKARPVLEPARVDGDADDRPDQE